MELESEFHYIYLKRFRYKNLATGFNVIFYLSSKIESFSRENEYFSGEIVKD